MTKRLAAVSLLTLLLGGFGVAATATSPSVQQSPEVGFVLYSRTSSPGTLSARWMYGETWRGPGIAIGGPREGFAGRYHVRYFYDDGRFSDEYDLVIENTGEIYKVTWLVEGELRALGVGMEVEDGLAVGWQRVGNQ